ncbi:MAG: sugar phosphate isomerase/epimerase [Candidatus Anammoximicrobium sp.]|nr:sugar phosphate isomerase/epimerase [Candidatus Anammoximicrobium sp.]
MVRLSMNELTTFRWSFDEDVRQYAAAGFDAIAVWRQKLSDFGEEKAVELLEDSPLSVSTLLWAGGFTGSDGRTYKESVEDALEAVQLAGDLKAESLVVYTGSRSGHTHNHAKRLFRNAMETLIPRAAECGVTLAIEPMHAGCASAWTFLTDLDETLSLLDSFQSPQVKLLFDAYHLGHVPDIVDRLPELVSRIALVQLGDARVPPCGEQNRCRLGAGTLPLQAIVAALVSHGYTGDLDIELMGEDMENPDYAELLADSRRVASGWLGDGG